MTTHRSSRWVRHGAVALVLTVASCGLNDYGDQPAGSDQAEPRTDQEEPRTDPPDTASTLPFEPPDTEQEGGPTTDPLPGPEDGTGGDASVAGQPCAAT